jgi:hypothetical protein
MAIILIDDLDKINTDLIIISDVINSYYPGKKFLEFSRFNGKA